MKKNYFKKTDISPCLLVNKLLREESEKQTKYTNQNTSLFKRILRMGLPEDIPAKPWKVKMLFV